MPRVDALPGTPQVGLKPLSDTTRPLSDAGSPASYGAQLGEAAMRVGFQIADAERRKQDQIILQGADNQLAQWETQHLDDPTSGALSVHGTQSFGLPDAVSQQYDDFASKLAASQPNDRVRQALQGRIAERRGAILERLDSHVRAEMQQNDVQESQAAVDNAATAAGNAASVGDAQRVVQERDRAAQAATDFAARQGFGPEQAQAFQTRAVTAVHSAVIDRLLASQQDQAASAYFEENKGEIASDRVAELQKALAQGNLVGNAQRASDQILASSTDEASALKQVQAITDPKLRDAVQERVEHGFALKEQATRQAREQLMVAAGNFIDQQPAAGAQAVPPSMWVQLTPDEKRSLELYAKRNGDPGGVQTNWTTFDTLNRLATSNDPKDREAFAKVPLPQYIHLLSPTDMRHFLEVQQAIRTGDTKKATALTASDALQNQIVDQALTGMGLNPNPPAVGKPGYDKTNSDRVVAFRRAVRDAVAVQEQQSGKRLTEPDVQRITDALTIQTVAAKPASGYLFWATPPAPAQFEFETRTPVATVDQIPASARRLLEQSAKANGKQATPANLVTWFNKYLQQLQGGAR